MTRYAFILVALASAGWLSCAHAAPALIFKPTDKPAACPGDVHPKNGCLTVTGTNIDSGAQWIRFNRTAFLGDAGAGAPAGCISVTTTGTLISAHGTLHFHGEGYYCPKTDTAVYHATFDAAEAKKFGMPVKGTISYDGVKDTETYSG